MKKGRVVWTDYTVDDYAGVLVRLSVRLEDGSKWNGYVSGTKPYIFAPEDELVPNKSYIECTESGYESLFDEELQKIVTETPKQAGNLTDYFSWTGEADVPYYRRVAIHDGLSGYIEIPDDKFLPYIDIDEISTDVERDEVIEPRISISDIEVRVPDDGSFINKLFITRINIFYPFIRITNFFHDFSPVCFLTHSLESKSIGQQEVSQ